MNKWLCRCVLHDCQMAYATGYLFDGAMTAHKLAQAHALSQLLDPFSSFELQQQCEKASMQSRRIKHHGRSPHVGLARCIADWSMMDVSPPWNMLIV